MTVGLLGGSFNPPHEGHNHISKIALKRLALDKLWWLVTPGNPIKSHDNLAPLEDRIAASQKLTNNPKIDITAFETAYGSVYTAATLKRLKQSLPGPKFVWIMGADNLRTIHLWRDWQSIFKTMPIVVIDRPEERYKSMASIAANAFRSAFIEESDAAGLALMTPPRWTFLTIKPSTLSSTELRQNDTGWYKKMVQEKHSC